MWQYWQQEGIRMKWRGISRTDSGRRDQGGGQAARESQRDGEIAEVPRRMERIRSYESNLAPG